ncbi:CRISPR-associated protein, Cse2 family [Streptomyces sp. TLI_053]|uniref:type I-E CRISPR-associated protein Cse2/CasB n=1 Tax=Streptomyces sp. TLI_053 TaxID=1855352 RepID=UPI00087CEC79|nr:type I-E CRISPR-associated protein Cse2/CasB [Streptomyces sp. TLI_053]SDT81893.1 CRISPR-associated protein, Cse2 family [Streptomyces sp. TLI_053]
MTIEQKLPVQRRPYWERYTAPDHTWRIDPRTGQPGRPPGEDLAAMRSGLGRPAMDSPRMWPLYSCEVDDWLALRDEVSDEQKAEHAALALFGLHQQSQSTPMHRRGVKLGQALRALRRSGRFSEDALDTRVAQLAGATSVSALLVHLRGLVTQLRTIGQPLDYNHLMADIRAWHHTDRRPQVRLKWAVGYQGWKEKAPAE